MLLKDYPEPQRSQILDMVYKPKFGASVSALLVEIPGDGNSTQGSMPSHMHTREDLNYSRGYMWWILSEAKKRNPKLSLDGTAWSAPGWVGEKSHGSFWSQDTADYYVKWLEGLRTMYGLELDAIGCRNEKGYSIPFAKVFRKTLDSSGFEKVKLHAFDHWPDDKFDFVKDMVGDLEARAAIDVLGTHVFYAKTPASAEVQKLAAEWGKPIWNTEEHVYLKGLDCAITIVQAFNDNFIHSGATKVVNWYDIAGVYPMQPYSEDPAMVVAWEPWSGHYRVREALWEYAHWGQFTEVGWEYLKGACGKLEGGGTFVTLRSPEEGWSVIAETKGPKATQELKLQVGHGMSKNALCLWKSNAKEQFVRQADVAVASGVMTIVLEPESIYSLSTTRGQQKGGFEGVPAAVAFPFPFFETFESYSEPERWGYLPRYFADIAGAFELSRRPDGNGMCLRQVVPVPTESWAPDWLPYSIFGDQMWGDYEISADLWFSGGEKGGVMGRVSHVGTGWGFIPKGYFATLSANGEVELVVVKGKKDKKKVEGDAEQQAAIRKMNDDAVGGEYVLGKATAVGVKAGQWHQVMLRFEGKVVSVLVDEKEVIRVENEYSTRGMAGLIAGGEKPKLSRPWFDNVIVKAVRDATPQPTAAQVGQVPMYPIAKK